MAHVDNHTTHHQHHGKQQDLQPDNVLALNLPANTSCLLVKTRTISIEPVPLPLLRPDSVLVRVMANGICGSDMHSYCNGGVGGRPIGAPSVMGHEAAGIIEAVGAAVTTHAVGDHVAVEPGLPCQKCINCKGGRMNICTTIRYCGTPGVHGTLSRFYVLPVDMAPKIPKSVPWDVADSGCGPIGLITAAVAHAYSARRIVAFDIKPSRVEFAKAYKSPLTGRPIIDHVFQIDSLPDLSPRQSDTNGTGTNGTDSSGSASHDYTTPGDKAWMVAQARMDAILDEVGLADEGGVDRVIEASGAQDAMLHGVAICKDGGVYLQVGLGHIQTNIFPTIAITNKELDVRGITRYTASCFPSAIEMLGRGVVDIAPLITASFPMSRAKDAFEAVAAGNDIKVIIRNQEV
ncbi:L-iditol 2-dehydrogenase [Sporothrix schenckii 1099-18]|uniref:D-xylulose reductase n=1 Tax=Sporothrix schenckii 1099-18 TaxID=1397361 RepID=A0A0F2MD85_SPOSC|nr:L-iditol 2-dehydrogenase [Sporothrix schenckii 1099-18]KJR87602.1 L-iditol 2-dehydrogenase [Sporothrix schenckii 1099-18]